MRKIILVMSVLALLLVAACAPQASESVSPAVTEAAPTTPQPTQAEGPATVAATPAPGVDPATVEEMVVKGDTSADSEVKEFTVRAFQFRFEPDTLEVNLGDTVVLNAYTADVPHGLKIPQYDIDMKLTSDTPVTVEFVANKEGTYPFYCSIPCGGGHRGMQGKLIVNGIDGRILFHIQEVLAMQNAVHASITCCD